MKIELSIAQKQTLFAWLSERVKAEVSGDCEPSGYTLEISFSVFEVVAAARMGQHVLELGEVHYEL